MISSASLSILSPSFVPLLLIYLFYHLLSVSLSPPPPPSPPPPTTMYLLPLSTPSPTPLPYALPFFTPYPLSLRLTLSTSIPSLPPTLSTSSQLLFLSSNFYPLFSSSGFNICPNLSSVSVIIEIH